MSPIFSTIVVILRLFKVWDQFLAFVDEIRRLEAEKKQLKLEEAVDNTVKVKTSEEAYAEQERIVSNKP